MVMILFVASNPSRLNKDAQVAMIGAKCEKTFTEWANYLVPNKFYRVVNVSDVIPTTNRAIKRSEYDLLRLCNETIHPAVTKVVALGNTAADALDIIGIKYFKLPHPSPLNRFLNNKEQVDAVLQECKQWIDPSSFQ